jgi:hypothetical protein
VEYSRSVTFLPDAKIQRGNKGNKENTRNGTSRPLIFGRACEVELQLDHLRNQAFLKVVQLKTGTLLMPRTLVSRVLLSKVRGNSLRRLNDARYMNVQEDSREGQRKQRLALGKAKAFVGVQLDWG